MTGDELAGKLSVKPADPIAMGQPIRPLVACGREDGNPYKTAYHDDAGIPSLRNEQALIPAANSAAPAERHVSARLRS